MVFTLQSQINYVEESTIGSFFEYTVNDFTTEISTMNSSSNETTTINTFEEFTRGLYIYGIPIICIFGILGNILSFKVFAFTSFGSHSSSTYIAALSLSDTGFLASLLLSWLGGGRIGVRYDSSPVWCHVMIYVTYVCSFLSVWYVVLIMLERYIVVCHSLRVSEWCTKRRARIATTIVTLFGMLLYSHTFYTAVVAGENCSIQFKPFMLRILSIFIYTDTAITFVIPFAIIFILNIIVIVSIKRFQIRHSLLKERKSNVAPLNVLSLAQFRITRTFIIVSMLLLVTNVPSHGIRFYILVRQLLDEGDTVLIHAQQVFQIIYYFNFAVNFLVYSVCNKKFRKYLTLKYVCSCCFRRRRQQNTEHLYR